MKDIIITNLRPQNYSPKDVCRIVNQKQMKLYVKNKVYPIDMYSSLDNDGNDIVVYIFLKEDTKDLYQAWIAHELE
jgi:hypothetical protein